jgi:hypothetical protein
MNASEKIAVSLPRGLAERARRAVRRGRAASVSAYVASALEDKVKLDELATLLDEMLSESGGPLTPPSAAMPIARLACRRRHVGGSNPCPG